MRESTIIQSLRIQSSLRFELDHLAILLPSLIEWQALGGFYGGKKQDKQILGPKISMPKGKLLHLAES